jgi:hypothetical protein
VKTGNNACRAANGDIFETEKLYGDRRIFSAVPVRALWKKWWEEERFEPCKTTCVLSSISAPMFARPEELPEPGCGLSVLAIAVVLLLVQPAPTSRCSQFAN